MDSPDFDAADLEWSAVVGEKQMWVNVHKGEVVTFDPVTKRSSSRDDYSIVLETWSDVQPGVSASVRMIVGRSFLPALIKALQEADTYIGYCIKPQ